MVKLTNLNLKPGESEERLYASRRSGSASVRGT